MGHGCRRLEPALISHSAYHFYQSPHYVVDEFGEFHAEGSQVFGTDLCRPVRVGILRLRIGKLNDHFLRKWAVGREAETPVGYCVPKVIHEVTQGLALSLKNLPLWPALVRKRSEPEPLHTLVELSLPGENNQAQEAQGQLRHDVYVLVRPGRHLDDLKVLPGSSRELK